MTMDAVNVDVNDYHEFNIVGTLFQVKKQYYQLTPIGMGAYGVVCSAKNAANEMNIAIKKVVNPFSSATLSKRTFRELKLLKHLRHENVIPLEDVFISPNGDVYMVTELFGADLHNVLASQKLNDQFICYFMFQLLRGLKYIHAAGVVHRDLKPSNILLNENCDLKIADFGLARVQDPEMTGYVATRYYRAPEIMLTWKRYDQAIDIWSAGCIMAEMFSGKPLFPGKDHIHQFTLITDLLGMPSDSLIHSICGENTLRYVQSLPRKEGTALQEKFKNGIATPLSLDLLSKMLVFDPRSRITADEALRHPYFVDFKELQDEQCDITPFDWSFASQEHPAEVWKSLTEQLVAEFDMEHLLAQKAMFFSSTPVSSQEVAE